MTLGPGILDLPAIIAAAVEAAAAVVTQGYSTTAVTTSPSFAATAPAACVLSLLKLLHLHFI